jgi:hypothetical protein
MWYVRSGRSPHMTACVLTKSPRSEKYCLISSGLESSKHGTECSCLDGKLAAIGGIGGGGAAAAAAAGLAGGGAGAGGAGGTGGTGGGTGGTGGLASSACGMACVLFGGALVAVLTVALVDACTCCCCC